MNPLNKQRSKRHNNRLAKKKADSFYTLYKTADGNSTICTTHPALLNQNVASITASSSTHSYTSEEHVVHVISNESGDTSSNLYDNKQTTQLTTNCRTNFAGVFRGSGWRLWFWLP